MIRGIRVIGPCRARLGVLAAIFGLMAIVVFLVTGRVVLSVIAFVALLGPWALQQPFLEGIQPSRRASGEK